MPVGKIGNASVPISWIAKVSISLFPFETDKLVPFFTVYQLSTIFSSLGLPRNLTVHTSSRPLLNLVISMTPSCLSKVTESLANYTFNCNIYSSELFMARFE
jgi:hypothetical protein